jgi:hypothetical protein
MGLFNFGDSKEKKEHDELMQKMSQQIFPGGKDQIDNEVFILRKVLTAYSEEDIRSALVHASALFYLSEDKSEENIVSGILSSKNNALDLISARTIYDWVSGRDEADDFVKDFFRK